MFDAIVARHSSYDGSALKVGIVGAGVVGRLLAWHLCQQACEVHLFDQLPIESENGTSAIAAGMIGPIAESHLLGNEGYALGLASLQWWPKILASLSLPVYYANPGTLVVTHPQHQALLAHFLKSIQCNIGMSLSIMDSEAVRSLEPGLAEPLLGAFLPGEAHINPRQLLTALADFVLGNGTQWYPQHQVTKITAKAIYTEQQTYHFDKTVDCRGLGAKAELTQLRGVRGERILCLAKDIVITHTIRVLHARFPCYIVPQSEHHYIIGATQFESENNDPIQISSTLALLSAAVNVHPGFHDAHIIDMKVACRPASVSSLPVLMQKEGVLYINGMFRHGYLLAPAIAAKACEKVRAEYESTH